MEKKNVVWKLNQLSLFAAGIDRWTVEFLNTAHKYHAYQHPRLWEMLTPHLYRYVITYLLGYISNFYNLKNGSFLLGFYHPQGYCSMLLIGRSVPQLRHEPIAYWFSLPQFGQFSTIEAVMLSYRCYSIKDSLWLYTLRNNQPHCDSESV